MLRTNYFYFREKHIKDGFSDFNDPDAWEFLTVTNDPSQASGLESDTFRISTSPSAFGGNDATFVDIPFGLLARFSHQFSELFVLPEA